MRKGKSTLHDHKTKTWLIQEMLKLMSYFVPRSH